MCIRDRDINPFIITDPTWNLQYVLGILNSKLISWLYINSSSIATKDDFRQTTLAELRRLPIPCQTKGDKGHDALVAHVGRMLKLHEELASAKLPDDQTRLTRDIAATARAIDGLVYALYGLTPAETALVEAATTPPAPKSKDDTPMLPPPGSESPAKPEESTPQSEALAAHFYFVKEDPPKP